MTPLAAGPDGGRDGKFHGTAATFPSRASPLVGHSVFQAKHVAAPDRSCSDRDFARLLKKEHKKIARLAKAGICDHYICFTNRKLTGGADEKLIAELEKLGVKTAHIIGVEKLHLALNQYQAIRDQLPNKDDASPFRFDPDDLIEVIGALHDFVGLGKTSSFDSAHDFEAIKIKDEKNRINGLTKDYCEQIIVNGSMVHFGRVEEFLKNPRNRKFAALYHDAADELKQLILVHRKQFESFDDVSGGKSGCIVRRFALTLVPRPSANGRTSDSALHPDLAWYPKATLTFSDAIAAVRRQRAHQISFMSRPRRDSIEIPRHIWRRMENALAYAA